MQCSKARRREALTDFGLMTSSIFSDCWTRAPLPAGVSTVQQLR